MGARNKSQVGYMDGISFPMLYRYTGPEKMIPRDAILVIKPKILLFACGLRMAEPDAKQKTT